MATVEITNHSQAAQGFYEAGAAEAGPPRFLQPGQKGTFDLDEAGMDNATRMVRARLIVMEDFNPDLPAEEAARAEAGPKVKADQFDGKSDQELRDYLDSKDVAYHPALGRVKLLERARLAADDGDAPPQEVV